MKLAMQLQGDLYGAGGPSKPPTGLFGAPPQPAVDYSAPPPMPDFQPQGTGAAKWLHLHDMHREMHKSRAPPTAEAVKRIMADYQEIIKSKHTHMFVLGCLQHPQIAPANIMISFPRFPFLTLVLS